MCIKHAVIKIIFFSLVAGMVIGCKAERIEKPVLKKIISYQMPTDMRYAQGMDILNGKVFQAFSDGTIDIYDLSNSAWLQTLGPFKNEKGEVFHMNDISFRKDNTVTYLIIPDNGINRRSFVYAVSEIEGVFIVDEVFHIPTPRIDGTRYKAATTFWGNTDCCIQVAYEIEDDNGFGDIVVESYVFDVFSAEMKFQFRWTVNHPKLWAMQGAWVDDNYCYLAVGVGNGDAKIYRITVSDGDITCVADFREQEDLLPNEEMQGISKFNDNFYISTTYGLYVIK